MSGIFRVQTDKLIKLLCVEAFKPTIRDFFVRHNNFNFSIQRYWNDIDWNLAGTEDFLSINSIFTERDIDFDGFKFPKIQE